MKKKISIAFICLMAVIMLSGCGMQNLDENQVLNDLEGLSQFDNRNIEEVIIQEYIPQREETEKVIMCEIISTDNVVKRNETYKITYFYNKEYGWVLDYASLENEESILPLVGVDPIRAISELENQLNKKFEGNDYKWKRDNELKYDNIEIKEELFTPLSNESSIIMSVRLSDDLVNISGDVELFFTFKPEYESWWFMGIEEKENYTEDWDIIGEYGYVSTLTKKYSQDCKFKILDVDDTGKMKVEVTYYRSTWDKYVIETGYIELDLDTMSFKSEIDELSVNGKFQPDYLDMNIGAYGLGRSGYFYKGLK